MIRLGAINSRVKDFYDVWALASEQTFTGAILTNALNATFTRRGTAFPPSTPLALTDAFVDDLAKRRLWQAFVSRNKLNPAAPTFTETIQLLRTFLLPPTQALLAEQPFDQHWAPGGPWITEVG